MDALRITPEQERWMLAHVLRWLPEEACGLLAGRGDRAERLFLIPNELHSPVKFRMEPQAQLDALLRIDELGLDMLAIFHSHPNGPPAPSPTDLAEFAYPGAATLILASTGGDWTARAFLIGGSSVTEIPLIVEN